MDINSLKWDDELLELLMFQNSLPKIVPSSGEIYGYTERPAH